MEDTYSKELIRKLVDENKWWPQDFTEEFTSLLERVDLEVNSNSISRKIAAIFIKHQAIHQMAKDLIDLSHLYVQGELWPTEFKPSYDRGKEKMTGWYIDYYEGYCIDCEGKKDFLKHFKRINEIRNKVAHNITRKNDVVINSSYKTFEKEFIDAVCIYNDQCLPDLIQRLSDLNKRVDFKELLEI